MTSDAKIGLLLGLVFIFIIAFIINGLPKLRGESDSNELTEIMMKNNPPAGIGGWERKADEVLSPPPQIGERAVEPQPTLGDSPLTVSNNTDVRYTVPIPGYSPLLRDSSNPQESQNPVGPVLATGDSLSTPKPAVADTSPTVQKTIEPTTTVVITPPKPAESKTHTVADGETLASIAKKYYGLEQGNKRANITRIFEANRKLLKSSDDIFVGQKLIIPALPTAQTKTVLSGPSFEQVKSIGQKLTLSNTAKPTSDRLYTVKDGDNLWTISADLLGNGIRYKEIAKLNTDVLPSEDDVRVGLQLRLPLK